MDSKKIYTVNDILQILEETGDTLLEATVYTEPPINFLQSDEESGDEEEEDINRLTGNQLLAPAQLRATTLTGEGIEHVSLGESEDHLVPSEPSASSEEISKTSSPSTSNNQTEPLSNRLKKRKIVRHNRKWEKCDITPKPEHEWERPIFLNSDRSPTEWFELFFDDQLVEFIRQQSKNYGMFKGHHNFDISNNEVRVFIAILLLSGYCAMARNRLYWESGVDVHHPGVANAMSRNRFEEILRYFHVSDNNNLNPQDKFAKVRPLWKSLNDKWMQYFPNDAYISIDESMVRYFGRHGAKQHIHNKPIRFGFKVWSMCTRLGYIIQAEPYQGASTGNTHPHLGCGGSVVVDLVDKLPPNGKYSLFTDNYFTSLPLLDELKEKGHDCTGTIRVDRIEKAPLSDPKTLKKLGRGSYEQVSEKKSGITLVRFNDNSVVTIASNRVGVHPMGSCSRWSNTEKKKISVKQPGCVSLYNLYMGGVDRLDQNVLAYKPTIRMKKWYWQLVVFPLSCSMNNAYQLYKLSPAGKDKGSLDFLSFIREVVQVYLGKCVDRPTLGRPLKPVKRRVPDGVRLDGVGHLIISSPTQIRCAECHKNTTKKCKKCDVGCHANCFANFHQ